MIDANSVSGTTRKFKNLIELRDHFSNEMVCIKHLEAMRWEKEGIYCPYCGHKKVYKFSDKKTYKCAKCRKRFNVKVGTIFENTKIPLQEWFMAIYYLTAHKKGISSLQLGRDIGVTQKTAWFMLHRLRVSAISPEFDKLLKNTVEADEAYLGGKVKNMHASKKPKLGSGPAGKLAIFGMVQRKGYVRVKAVSRVDMGTLRNNLLANVRLGSRLMTDEYTSYSGLGEFYNHKSVNHVSGNYVSAGNIHTNTIESFWAGMKRSIYGIYHSISRKHIDLYLNEFTYRYNTRKETDETKFNLVLSNCNGRLRYAQLIQKQNEN